MSQYRVYAKAVAIVDLVLAAFSILFVVVMVIIAATAAAAANDKNFQDKIRNMTGPNHPTDDGLNNVAIWVLCVAVLIWAILTALQMWAALRLLSATEIGCEPVEALRLAATWRNISVVCLVINIFGLLALGMYISVASSLLFRGGMIYVVFLYMRELEMITAPAPVSISVGK